MSVTERKPQIHTLIQSHFDPTPVEDLTPEVQQTIDAALDRGELIGAIKHYRAATGAGLAESKAAVETRRWKRGE